MSITQSARLDQRGALRRITVVVDTHKLAMVMAALGTTSRSAAIDAALDGLIEQAAFAKAVGRSRTVG